MKIFGALDDPQLFERFLCKSETWVACAHSMAALSRIVAGQRPYLELFARETKRGWDCWGDQVGLFNTEPVQTRRQPSRLTDAHGACSAIGE